MASPLWMLITTYHRRETEVDALLVKYVQHLERQRATGCFMD